MTVLNESKLFFHEYCYKQVLPKHLLCFIQIVKFFVEQIFKENVQEPSLDLIKKMLSFKFGHLTFLKKYFHNKRNFYKYDLANSKYKFALVD